MTAKEDEAERLEREDAAQLDAVFAAVGDFPGAPSAEELARYPFNDFGNAQRLMRLVRCTLGDHGDAGLKHATLLYLREVGWIAFNGKFWDLKAGEQLARRTAHKVAQVVPNLWPVVRDRVSAKEWWKWATGCGQSGATGAMLKQAESYLTVDWEAFDHDPLALNCQNGVLRFSKGKDGVKTRFVPGHRPADRFTRMAAVDYDPEAKAPLLRQCLETWQPRAEWRSFLHAIMGYSATGLVHEQAFFIFQGLGRDGKSTLLGLLRDLMGTYACNAGVETFLDTGPKRGGDASADIARLAGDTRLVSTAEPPKNSKLADNMLKSFTGGEPILARMLHKGFFEFQPLGKVIMQCNGLPKPQGDDEGIWRRLKIVLWQNQIAKGSEDKTLPYRLRDEMAGALNWLIEGVELYLRDGLVEPDEALEALAGYRRSGSPFGEWVMERLVMDKESKTLASDLYADFKEWFKDQGHDEKTLMSQRAFGLALNDRQILFAGKDGSGKVQRRGARLKMISDMTLPQPAVGGPGGQSPQAVREREPGEDDDLAGWGDEA